MRARHGPMRRSCILLLAMVTACSVARPAEDASGEEIYAALCANCHGSQLEGGLAPALGPGSNSAGRPDDFLEISITHGRGRMPSFESSLSDSQVRLLVDYVRERQGK